MDLDSRTVALVIGRGRAVIGLVMIFVPGIAARLWFGESTPRTRGLLRMIGIRDLILGVGALTTTKERTMDAEWLGMGAVADAVDGVVALTMRDVPGRGRVLGPAAFGSAVVGLKIARDLADERKTAAASE